MSDTLNMRPQDLAEIRTILATYLPPEAHVFVFGSRANGRVHRASDLAVDAARQLTLDEICALNTAFDDANLPYTVDVVDLHGIDPRFREVIDRAAKKEIFP